MEFTNGIVAIVRLNHNHKSKHCHNSDEIYDFLRYNGIFGMDAIDAMGWAESTYLNPQQVTFYRKDFTVQML